MFLESLHQECFHPSQILIGHLSELGRPCKHPRPGHSICTDFQPTMIWTLRKNWKLTSFTSSLGALKLSNQSTDKNWLRGNRKKKRFGPCLNNLDPFFRGYCGSSTGWVIKYSMVTSQVRSPSCLWKGQLEQTQIQSVPIELIIVNEVAVIANWWIRWID